MLLHDLFVMLKFIVMIVADRTIPDLNPFCFSSFSYAMNKLVDIFDKYG